MASRHAGDITQLLGAAKTGDQRASAALAELVYEELRQIARRQMRRERPGHTLQPTALVHEAFVKLLGKSRQAWQGRAHFFASAANVMNRILIDHSRAVRAQKRGGNCAARLPLDENIPEKCVARDQVLAIEQALTRLQTLDPRQSRVVEMRIYGGLTERQVAQALGMSERTVKRDWNMALAYLHSEMSRSTPK
jgi:RNA polymerase sigma-70 factor, ECF subfamily